MVFRVIDLSGYKRLICAEKIIPFFEARRKRVLIRKAIIFLVMFRMKRITMQQLGSVSNLLINRNNYVDKHPRHNRI